MSDRQTGRVDQSMVPQVGTVLPLAGSQGERRNNLSASSSSNNNNNRKRKLTVMEVASLRRKMSESEGLRIVRTASRYAERCAVRCYLGGGGSPAEYPTWRNRLPPVPLISYLIANKLDTENPSEDLYSLLRNASSLMRTTSNETPSRVPSASSPPVAPQEKVLSKPHRLSLSPYKSSSPSKHDDVSPSSNQEHIVERARQEANVMQRIGELQRDGLWSEKRVPKLQELQRPKAHWDYLLEEMVWLAADFAQERMWKKAAAKKCARMVQKYFQEKELNAQKEVRAREANLRRIASVMAKEVKLFWSDVEKLVDFKQRTVLEEKRKKALNQHLTYFVENTPTLEQPEVQPSSIETVNDEVLALTKESVIPLEDLLGGYLDLRDRMPSSPTDRTADDEVSSRSTTDDEGMVLTHDDESSVIHQEAIELDENGEVGTEDCEDDDDSYEDDSSDGEQQMEIDADESENLPISNQAKRESVEDKKKVVELEEVIELAESLIPKGNTLSSANVATEVPFLLKHKLREYQHVGFDWLVTMYENNLNGILADEMGLGKTVQTIALLAHLACKKGNWGPHLIVVPSSEMLNWEMELKKWCPGFKILTYFGSVKERQSKRIGWTKPNSFHVCITSYKLVIEDHLSFRRKKWKYLILDEAQYIKNFKSPRWQLLLNFRTQRRLLLTGTPPKNNHPELKSIVHFLIPDVSDQEEFKEGSNPAGSLRKGSAEMESTKLYNVLRPLSLRRVKSQVETQMPKKFEHIVMCSLSNRQQYLYDDYMSKSKTKETLASGNMLNVLNVLMELRKVCNHPNLFEGRPTLSSFQMESLVYRTAFLVTTALDYDPLKNVDLTCLNFILINLERWLSAFAAHRARRYKSSRKLIEEIDSVPEVVQCPRQVGGIKVSVQKKNSGTPSQQSCQQVSKCMVRPTLVQLGIANNHKVISTVSGTKIGTSPIVKAVVQQSARSPSPQTQGVTLRLANPVGQLQNYLQIVGQQGGVKTGQTTRLAHIVNTPTGKQIFLSQHQLLSSQPSTVVTSSGQRLTVVSKQGPLGMTSASLRPLLRLPPLALANTQNILLSGANMVTIPGDVPPPTHPTGHGVTATKANPAKLAKGESSDTSKETEKVSGVDSLKENTLGNPASSGTTLKKNETCKESVDLENDDCSETVRRTRRKEKLDLISRINDTRCGQLPVYGVDVTSALTLDDKFRDRNWLWTGGALCRTAKYSESWLRSDVLYDSILTSEERLEKLEDVISRFVMCVNRVQAPSIQLGVCRSVPWKTQAVKRGEEILEEIALPLRHLFHPIASAMQTQFPDKRLLQYDCGKLQVLNTLLRQLKIFHHRVLIFTQMTRMLDILEAFLNFHGHVYLRLDGSTKVEQRQVLMERFNNDRKIFCFILSTRSGGVGVNLTGADTVIFYDSDWNPTMDGQVRDRCQRIMQKEDINIYRLISEKTVEENFIKKSIQKRMLSDLAVEGGNFSTAYFKTYTIQDLFDTEVTETSTCRRMVVMLKDCNRKEENTCEEVGRKNIMLASWELALSQVEDDCDVSATEVVRTEMAAQLAEFDESITVENQEPLEQLSKAELELEALELQLSGVERYAMRFIEEVEATWAAQQISSAELRLEEVKRGWEASRSEAEREDMKRKWCESFSDDEDLTYSGLDARCQEWVTKFGLAMPMWAPPTPPQDDSDVYIDEALCLLYEPSLIPEAQLPPAYTKKERKRSRMEMNIINSRLQSNKMRQKEETLVLAPRSLFDRPTPALVKMRQELRLQRYRGLMRPSVQNLLKAPPLVKPLPEPDHVPDWLIHEDWTILQAVQHVQEMTLNLVILSPGHTVNWDLVADMVNMSSRTYRSPKQCRNRYESVIIPREEGKPVLDSPKKQKKNKMLYKLPQMKSGRPLRTSQLFQQDNNSSVTQVMNCRFDAIRSVSNRRAPTVKPLLVDPAMKNNPRHADTLARSQIDYEQPLTPVEVAARRAERIAREKHAITNEQQLAVLRQQQLQNIGKMNIATVAGTNAPRQLTTLTVQEMVATVGGSRTVVSSGVPRTVSEQKSSSASSSPSTSSSPSSPSTVPTTKTPKTISATQLALYRQHQQHQQQAILRQQHLKLLKTQQAAGTGQPKVSIAVTSPSSSSSTAPRMQQVVVKSGRAVTESEMVALLKRQQAAKVAGLPSSSTAPTLTTAQILTSIHVKALNTAGGETTTVLPQQVKQLSIQQQLLAAAHQRGNKLTQQKVAQFSQVATKGGVTGTQLIVQSGHKTIPTTMTVQQIQQVMKQVRPQHVVMATGPGRVTSTTIPAGTVSLEGRQVLAGALKTSQQAILTQVSAVVPGTTIRQPVTSTPLVAVTSATPLISIPPTSTTQSSSDSQPQQ